MYACICMYIYMHTHKQTYTHKTTPSYTQPILFPSSFYFLHQDHINTYSKTTTESLFELMIINTQNHHIIKMPIKWNILHSGDQHFSRHRSTGSIRMFNRKRLISYRPRSDGYVKSFNRISRFCDIYVLDCNDSSSALSEVCPSVRAPCVCV